jgi:hypothetical protein
MPETDGPPAAAKWLGDSLLEQIVPGLETRVPVEALEPEAEGLMRAVGSLVNAEPEDIAGILEAAHQAEQARTAHTPESCRQALGRNAEGVIALANDAIETLAARLTPAGRAELYRYIGDERRRRNPAFIAAIAQAGLKYRLAGQR